MSAEAPLPIGPYSGRPFTEPEIQALREMIRSHPEWSRRELSRHACDLLMWFRADGRPKDMSCRVAMLAMDREGLLELPAPRQSNTNHRPSPRVTPASDPKPPITFPAGDLGELLFRLVARSEDSAFWNELIQRYHYLGHKTLTGAQLRYFVHTPAIHDPTTGGPALLALLGFAGAAWKVAPRDRFIGWTPVQRQRNLPLVVNNARFLILPWVSSRNLASRILAQAATRLPADWTTHYGYQPVLLETFVDQTRFTGTCYCAANWIRVGETQGRGKRDVHHRHLAPVKSVLLYPLHRQFRQRLCCTT